jgi:mono/diheme cytochrome c family protein
MIRSLVLKALVPAALVCAVSGCRGDVSDQPPVHIIPDMDYQPKYLQQGESRFFSDHRANRTPPEGTVARGQLKEDTAFYEGRIGDQFVSKVPIDVDEKLVRRGQERFNIYCTPCHDQTGSGNGLVFQHGFPKPLSVTADHAKSLSDGELFDILSRGVRNMPGYAAQVPEKDRWAIVSWVRVLQRSQNTLVADVPPEELSHIQPAEEPAP